MALIELEDGTAIADVLQQGGPAEGAGMSWGAQILPWEGDHDLQGAVQPDIRVPLTRETVYAMFVEREDVIVQWAMEALQGP